MRKYPVGIQSFEKMRTDGYVYVDKTPLIYKMITGGCPYFLSRPRRFGKSLLVSTLEAVFQGRRELFEAFTTEDGIPQPQLFIATTPWRWEKYPVLRFDFSKDLIHIEELEIIIDSMLSEYENQYGISVPEKSTSLRMDKLVRTAHAQTGRRVVVLVDEYDKHMLGNIGNEENMKYVRSCFKSLFSPLKYLDDHLQFVFVTGISKFSQMGVFSTINQIENISMQPAYESLCGISQEELTTCLRPDIEQMASMRGETYEQTLAELKRMYDGYHFSENMTDIYNPFSLMIALDSGQIKKHWFDSATPSALIAMLRQMPPLNLENLEERRCPVTAFDLPFDTFQAPLPVLYQSGYLTIKDYLPSRDLYVLGFPNAEVRTGFADTLYQIVTGTQPDEISRNVFLDAYYDFRDYDDLPAFIEAIKTFYSSLPYQWEKDNRNEHYYHALLYTLLTAFGADVLVEESSARGNSDITLKMPRGIYIMELKYDHTAQEALDQIDRKGYADKYALDGRSVTKVGINISSKDHNINEWIAEPTHQHKNDIISH